MELTNLTTQLAAIRQKFISIIERINLAAQGEPFYARIFLSKDRKIVGLISKLRVNEYKIVFTLTEEKVIEGKIEQQVSEQKLSFEDIRRIEIFKTLSGKPIFLPDSDI